MKILRILFWGMATIISLVESGILFPCGGMNAFMGIVLMFVAVICACQLTHYLWEVR